MKLIKQKHSMGCAIACLAMILDMDYDSVMLESRINPEQGARRWQMQEYLRTKNYRIEYKYYEQVISPHIKGLHLCSCFYQEDTGMSHVILIHDNNIYNPDPDANSDPKFEDLYGIRFIAAVDRIKGLQ